MCLVGHTVLSSVAQFRDCGDKQTKRVVRKVETHSPEGAYIAPQGWDDKSEDGRGHGLDKGMVNSQNGVGMGNRSVGVVVTLQQVKNVLCHLILFLDHYTDIPEELTTIVAVLVLAVPIFEARPKVLAETAT